MVTKFWNFFRDQIELFALLGLFTGARFVTLVQTEGDRFFQGQKVEIVPLLIYITALVIHGIWVFSWANRQKVLAVIAPWLVLLVVRFLLTEKFYYEAFQSIIIVSGMTSMLAVILLRWYKYKLAELKT